MAGTVLPDKKGAATGTRDRKWRWVGLANGETAEAALNDGYADGYVQVSALSGTPVYEIHGTDEEDGNGAPTGYSALLDANGNTISLNANGWALLQILPKWIKPVVASGTGSATLSIQGRGN